MACDQTKQESRRCIGRGEVREGEAVGNVRAETGPPLFINRASFVFKRGKQNMKRWEKGGLRGVAGDV